MNNRVIVIAKHRFLGDTMVTLPLVQHLASECRAKNMSLPEIVTGSGPSVLLQNHPDLSKVHVVRKEASIRTRSASKVLWQEYFRIAREIRSDSAPSACYVVDRSFRSAAFARLCGSKCIIGFPTEARGFLLTHRVPYESMRTEIDAILALSGTSQALCQQYPKLYISTEEDQASQHGTSDGVRIAIQPGASHEYKKIKPVKWVDLINTVNRPGITFVLVGGPEESADAVQIVDACPDVNMTNLVGKTQLRDLMVVLASCDLFVGADTGLSHIAAAVSTKTLTLFGPTPAHQWGRTHAPHRILIAPNGVMDSISVSLVHSQILEMIR